MKNKILIPQDIAVKGKEYLINHGYDIKMGSGATEKDLIKDVKDCDAILLRTAPCTKAVLEAGKKLRVVARHGSGYNNVDLDVADRLGIWVTNVPDAPTNSVAEYTIGAIIASAKRILLMIDKMREGDFFYKNNHLGVDLIDKTLGIIGFGRIGREVAKKAYYGLGMKIIAYDPFADKDIVPEYISLVNWEAVFRESDFLTLHLPYTKKNAGLIGSHELNLMKSTSYIVNCSRGGIIKEDDLIHALKENVIAGLYTDVYEVEPPAIDCIDFLKNQLLSMDNVIATPHIAANTEECTTNISLHAAMQIEMVLSGKTPSYAVNNPQK